MPTTPHSNESDARTQITRLRTQHGDQVLGVPCERVTLSWQVRSEHADARQVAWQVRARRADEDWTELEPAPGPDQIGIQLRGLTLRPRESWAFSVRIATQRGWTEWSEPTHLETGVPGSELTARVIDVPSVVGGPVPIFRAEFDLDAIPDSARLRVSALGIYDVALNGESLSDGVLNPGWTAYQERIYLDTLDVTSKLRPGRNAIAIRVADGWYRGRFGWMGRTGIYGDRIGAVAQLETTTNGSTRTVLETDESWAGGFGSVRAASIYDGTDTDATVGDETAISTAGFDTSSWTPVSIIPLDTARFEPRSVPPVRTVAEFAMTSTQRPAATQLDAGQNVSGWVRLVVDGRRGDVVTVRHAEVLDQAGDAYYAALRTARATDTYVLGADGSNILEPAFTFHGFRYAEVTGAAHVVSATAVAISTDVPARSRLHTSHGALNRFHENVRWSQLDNFVSIPTDCPQRDERLGWTGDAQAFAATSVTLFETESFWQSWLRDLELEQSDERGVPSIVPDILEWGDFRANDIAVDILGRAGWADAATVVPMAVYDSYGSKVVLERQLSSMQRWVEHLRRRAGDDVLLPEDAFQYGDWLDPDAPGERPWLAKVDPVFVANAFYVHSVRLLARAETELGLTDESARHRRLADDVAHATWERWGAEAPQTQTGASMCLQFDIVPADARAALAAELARNVRSENGRIATGFLGTPLVLDALSSTGHWREAFLMLLRREAPSWLYQVDRGATTVWERWDAIKPDGSIHDGQMGDNEGDSMLSFNHYAYGAVLDWIYRNVAGLALTGPGYRSVRIAPRPCADLTSADALIETPYGAFAITWQLEGDEFFATVEVPFGVRAELDLPTTADSIVTINGTEQSVSTVHAGTHRISIQNPAVVNSAVARSE